MILPDVKFSAKELRASIFYMVISGIACLVLAAVTFECEYVSGLCIENIMEMLGILDMNWISIHKNLFMHIIQVLFVITFLVEIKIILTKTTKGWRL